MDNAPTTVPVTVPATGLTAGAELDDRTDPTAATTGGDTDELLIEEISIDGMCGVY
jgi:mycofactocin precursor